MDVAEKHFFALSCHPDTLQGMDIFTYLIQLQIEINNRYC